jgi:hypothetical protein
MIVESADSKIFYHKMPLTAQPSEASSHGRTTLWFVEGDDLGLEGPSPRGEKMREKHCRLTSEN